ncbi:MAG: Amuc_1099 family pilus-like system protein [Verrucomicrobiota bacterium]
MKGSYEKILLGVGAVIAVAMIVLGVMGLGSVEEDFTAANERNYPAEAIAGATTVEAAGETLRAPVALLDKKTIKGREVGMFIGVPLFVEKGKDDVVDLANTDTPAVHAPIPNLWWLEQGIDPGFANSPQRDEDQDGFSNLEEWEAKTDPTDLESFPSLFNKVELSQLVEEPFYLRFSNFGAAGLNFRGVGMAGGSRADLKLPAGAAVKPGELFFPDGPYANRFKFVELFQKNVRNIPRDFAKVEDQKDGKKGRMYEIASNNRGEQQIKDYTARLYLNTPALKGEIFDVQEGTAFSLPYSADAAVKPYVFSEVKDDGNTVVLLWNDNGEMKTRELRVP